MLIFPVLSHSVFSLILPGIHGDCRCHQPFVFWKWNWKHKSRWASGRTFSLGGSLLVLEEIFLMFYMVEFYVLYICVCVVMVIWGYGINSFSSLPCSIEKKILADKKFQAKIVFTWKLLSYLFNKKMMEAFKYLMEKPLCAGCGRKLLF